MGIDYCLVFEQMPAKAILFSPDFRIINVTDAYLGSTLMKRDELIGKCILEAFPSSVDAMTSNGVSKLLVSIENAKETLETDKMEIQEFEIHRPDGTFEKRQWSPTTVPIVDNGELVCVMHCIEDVTSARDAVGSLRIAGETLRSIADIIGEALTIVEGEK